MGKMENANAVKYIRKMYLASGKSRLIYSFVNILFIGLAVALSFAVYFSFNFMLNENFIAGLLLLIVTIAMLLFLFVQGVVGQLSLLFFSLNGMFRKEERGYQIGAFSVCLTSIAAAILTVVFLLF